MRKGYLPEIGVYAIIIIVGVLILSHYDAFEALHEFTRTHEEYELDEMILAVPLAFLCMTLFAWRRLLELKRERSACNEVRHELVQACSMLEDVSLFREEFILKACTELRDPLKSSLQTLNGLKRPEDRKDARILDRVNSAMDDVFHRIDDISSAMHPTITEKGATQFKLSDLFESVRLLTQTQADAKRLSFHFLRANDVPDAYVCDMSYLRIALLTLVGNAIKHTCSGRVCVLASYNPGEAGRVAISVTDTGDGIAEKTIDAIFDMTRDLKMPKDLDDCFGMSLPLIHRLLKRSGGRLSVLSQEGRGSEFTISFPAAPA